MPVQRVFKEEKNIRASANCNWPAICTTAPPLYSRVKLKAGKNRIFIKCSQFNNREAEVWSERAWGFYFTIVDENPWKMWCIAPSKAYPAKKPDIWNQKRSFQLE